MLCLALIRNVLKLRTSDFTNLAAKEASFPKSRKKPDYSGMYGNRGIYTTPEYCQTVQQILDVLSLKSEGLLKNNVNRIVFW